MNQELVFSEEHGRLIGLFFRELQEEPKEEVSFFDERGKLIAVVRSDE